MVEFMSGYRTAMDEIEQIKPMEEIKLDIEKPIIPISEIGTTVIDNGNILQNFENMIRFGTKKVQFVISGQGQGVPSSLSSTWGKDVRQALREKAKATGVTITGVELSPQMIQGLSGIDQRGGGFSEANRQHELNAVRDAIRFAADVSRGGGIDIYSQEFQRNILDAKWNTNPSKADEKWKNAFYDYTQEELDRNPETLKKLNIVKYLIDKRTGQPVSGSGVRVGESVTRIKYQTAKDYEDLYGEKIIGRKTRPDGTPLSATDTVDYEGNYVDRFKDTDQGRLVPLMKNHNFETHEVPWENIVEETAEYNKQNNRSGDRALTTEEYLYRQKMLNDQARVAGQGLQYSQNLDREQQLLHDMLKRKQMVAEMEQNMTAEQRREYIRTSLLPNVESLPQRERELLLSKKPSEVLAEEADRLRTRILAEQEAASSYKVAADEYKQIMESITTPDKFAREKTFQSYKEMGIEAMKVTKDRKLDKPIYVGPEIGMASEMYGGHPDEFIELIKESRKRMAKDLENQGMNSDAAKKAAADHIKGMMDTSHMMMWYKHFKRNKGESDEKHIKRFNEWLVEQSKRMVQEGVVGGVQVVDTITGDHAHLPAGQGAFDITGMVRAMKEAGFKGDIISEGHSEDSSGLGQGRILTETWRAFGSPIGNYVRGQPGGLRTWGGIQSAYFGHTPATHYIVGAYVPSNEWSLWSEVPFE